MTTKNDFRTNGTHAQFSDWRFDFDDGKTSISRSSGIQEFNWSENVDRGEERQEGSPFVEDVTTGDYSAEGSMVWKREAWDAFTDQLAKRGLGRFDWKGNATCVYTRKDGKVMTVTIRGVMLKKIDSQNKQGTEATKVNIDLQITGRIYVNGQGPFKNDRL